ncbi:MAG: hypothetical protein SO231_08875 [Phocaeicola vulgatus]|nr:hypothetical protein [Phocaeicola vulgatus]
MHYARRKSLPGTIYLIHERGNRIENALRCLNSGKESYGTYCGRGGRLKTVALECMLNAIPSTAGGKANYKAHRSRPLYGNRLYMCFSICSI